MGPVCNLFYSILAIYEDKESTGKQAVLEYLMWVEDWGEMELRLYAMFGFVLDVETTYVLMGTALKRSKQYLDVPAASKLLYTILSKIFQPSYQIKILSMQKKQLSCHGMISVFYRSHAFCF